MSQFNVVSVDVFATLAKSGGRSLSPGTVEMIEQIKSLSVGENEIFEVVLEDGEKPLTVHQTIVRAASAKYANVPIVTRRSDAGYYVALVTENRPAKMRKSRTVTTK